MPEIRRFRWPLASRSAPGRGALVAAYGVGVVAVAVLGAAYLEGAGPLTTPSAAAAWVAALWTGWASAAAVGPFQGLAYAGGALTAVGLLDAVVGAVRSRLSTDASRRDPLAVLASVTPARTADGDAIGPVPGAIRRLPSVSSAVPSTVGVRLSTALPWGVVGVVFGYGPARGVVRGELLVSAGQAVGLVCIGAVVHYLLCTRSRVRQPPSIHAADAVGGVAGATIGFAFTSQLWALVRAAGGEVTVLGAGLLIVGVVVAAVSIARRRRPSRAAGAVDDDRPATPDDDATLGTDTPSPEERWFSGPPEDQTGDEDDGGLVFGPPAPHEEVPGLRDRPSRRTVQPDQSDRSADVAQDNDSSSEGTGEDPGDGGSSDDR
jgi:hypothetical protein